MHPHLAAQKRLLPDERIVGRKSDHSDHDEQEVFAYVALGKVRAAAVWMHANRHRVNVPCVAWSSLIVSCVR